MLGKIFYIYFTEISQAGMKCKESALYSFYLHSFQQLSAKMQSGSRSDNSAFVFCKNILVTIYIIRFGRTIYVAGKRGFSQLIKSFLKFFMSTVKQETQSTSPRCRIIYDLGNHRIVFTEI